MGVGVGFGTASRLRAKGMAALTAHTRGWPPVRVDQAAVAARKDLWVLDHLERVVGEHTSASKATRKATSGKPARSAAAAADQACGDGFKRRVASASAG